MVHEHLSHLKLDRRMLRRRGWVPQRELDKELSALPDVADKAKPPDEDEAATAEPAGAKAGPA